MSAEIPQNQPMIETSSGQQTDPLAKVQTVCPVVQQHREIMQSESDPSYPSQSLSQETFEQVSDVGTSQHTQHLMSQRLPKESRGQDELLLQLQVKQLQKVLQEQNALLSLISPGLILSPTFLAHLQAQTPSGFPHTVPVNLTENSPALKENLTKPTLSGEVENEPEGTDVTVNRTQSIEPRILSPIKEEWSEPPVDTCFCSPFGSRRNVLANPEERPIRPGLKEKQKTFEEFVEEHLKVHQPVLQQDDQTCTQIPQSQKKDFLRKGEGMSRIGKGKGGSQIIQRRNSLSPQFMNLKSMPQKISHVELHQNGEKNEMPHISRTKHRRYSLPNVKDLGKLGDQRCVLKEFQRKSVDPQDANLQKQAYKPLTSRLVDKTNLIKNKHSSEDLGKTDKAMSQKSGLNKPSCPRDVRKVDSFNKNVGFKKINDHIVKVKEKNDPATSHSHGRSERNKEFGLSNKVMESLALSDSNDSTSSEDGPISQSHRPLPHFPSRHTDHKDESLDLSDDDYASDAPSETEIVSKFSEKHCSSTPTSSSSSSSSDSELQSLQITNNSKKTEGQHVQPEGKCPGDTLGDFRPPSAPERLGKETGEDDHTPVSRHKEDPSEICTTQDLRQQIFSLKQKLMEREVHWSQVHNLLQNRVEALTRENQELYSKLSGNERSQLGSYNTCDKGREEMQRNSGARSAFNKPSVQKKETQTGHLANEHTAISLRKSSACSLDLGNPDINAMITGRQGSLFYRNIDCSDAKMTSQSRKDQVKEEIRYPDGRVERLFVNGCRVITFRNGTKKEIGIDRSITVTFFNGDVKRILADGTVIYYYCDAQTTHSTYPSGLEVLQFPNNQKEKRYPDGKREIAFLDGTVKILYPNGQEESIFPDGTVVRISKHGEKIVEFTNGQREIHTAQYKRRIYPDGTIKTVYTNGRQETKFSSGRVRIKNNEGIVIMDKK